jgi:hypothetical protein
MKSDNNEASIEQGFKDKPNNKQDSAALIGLSEIYDTVEDLSQSKEESHHQTQSNSSDDLYDSISVVKKIENRKSKPAGTILDVGNLKFFSRNLDENLEDSNSDFSLGSGDYGDDDDIFSESDDNDLNNSIEVPVEDFEGAISEELNSEDLAHRVNVNLFMFFNLIGKTEVFGKQVC